MFECMCFSRRKPELILISNFGEKCIVNLLFCDLFAGTFAFQNFQSCEFKCCRYDKLIIILKDVFRLITSVEQRKTPESPWGIKTYYLCGSVVEHRSAESEGLKVFQKTQDEKHLSLFLNRAQNLSSLLFLIITFSNRNRMSQKYQVFVPRPKPFRERQFHGVFQYRKIEILLTFCRNRKNRLRARRNIADYRTSWDFIVLYLKVDWLDLKMVESLV